MRFEGIAPDRYIDLFFESLPVVIAIKLGAFFFFGLYRNVWRYVSVEDLVAIAKAITLGSLICILVFTYLSRFQGHSRAVFIIDWGLLLVLVSGIRLLFRGLREYFSRARSTGKRVLIMGAGDAGEMLLRELRNNPRLGYLPVGFLDDDPEAQKNIIEQRLMLGESPQEAVADLLKASLRSGMMPIINAMAAAGLVSLPGMMTGQILAGNSPTIAVNYQIFILFLIAAGAGFGMIIASRISSRLLFDKRARLRLDRLSKSIRWPWRSARRIESTPAGES